MSLTIEPGEMVAMYGPSGSGKSTLLQLVAALMPPDSGKVLVDGRDIAALSQNAAADYRRDQLGYIRQEPDLMAGADARDNAALKLFDTGIGVRAAQRRCCRCWSVSASANGSATCRISSPSASVNGC